MVETPFPVRKQATRLAFMTREDGEWERAWSQFPDRAMWNPEYQESLQYMGSVETYPGAWRHEFRHRAVPGTHQRQYWYIPASEGWTPSA